MWAVVSLVVGILGALGGWCLLGIPCIVAVLAGHFALGETRDGTMGGRGMAVAGLILGYVFGVPWALLGFFGILGGAMNISGGAWVSIAVFLGILAALIGAFLVVAHFQKRERQG